MLICESEKNIVNLQADKLVRMKLKDFLKTNVAFVLEMFLLAFLVGLLIIWGVFKWLNNYTEHGKEYEVPNVCGMYVDEAEITLQTQNIGLQVIDSTYTTRVPFGTIVEQNPAEGALVKSGRPVYVIINANSIKQVPIPDLNDISYRQARAALQALNIEVADVRYEPSEYRDLVLAVESDGKRIEAGTRLPEGSKVILVVGYGKGTEQVYVPTLTGRSLSEARQILLGARLIVGAVNYDDPSQTDSTYIYMQQPEGGRWVVEGSHIDLYLSQDTTKAYKQNNYDEEEFF